MKNSEREYIQYEMSCVQALLYQAIFGGGNVLENHFQCAHLQLTVFVNELPRCDISRSTTIDRQNSLFLLSFFSIPKLKFFKVV